MKITIYSLAGILGMLYLISMISCKNLSTIKNAENSAPIICPDCNLEGKDFSGMDGCGMMIVLDNGEKLQPIEYDSDKPEIRDGQRIKFGYKEAKDQIGICMSGKMVKITCIEFIGSTTTTGATRPSGTGDARRWSSPRKRPGSPC